MRSQTVCAPTFNSGMPYFCSTTGNTATMASNACSLVKGDQVTGALAETCLDAAKARNGKVLDAISDNLKKIQDLKLAARSKLKELVNVISLVASKKLSPGASFYQAVFAKTASELSAIPVLSKDAFFGQLIKKAKFHSSEIAKAGLLKNWPTPCDMSNILPEGANKVLDSRVDMSRSRRW